MDRTKVTIDGHDFYFDSALLVRFAYVMGEPVADVGSLRYEILTFAITVPAAVKTYGLEELTKMVEERLCIQVKGCNLPEETRERLLSEKQNESSE